MKTVVCIDAGHGINTLGKRIPCASYVHPLWRGCREWALNQRVAKYVEELLQPWDVDVRRTDDISGAKDISLMQRKSLAKSSNLFVSIHHNAGLNGRNGGGITVYYHPNRPNMEAYAKHLYAAVTMRNTNRGDRATPVAAGKYSVINTGNPAPIAVLIECGFMDGREDWLKIVQDDYARQCAQGIAEFIIGVLQLKARK